MNFDEFAQRVGDAVPTCGIDGEYTHPDAHTWQRGLLTVTLFAQAGRAFVSYLAQTNNQSPFGIRTGVPGLPYELTPEDAGRAAAEIATRLNDPYLYN
jgi:hypothetical protein